MRKYLLTPTLFIILAIMLGSCGNMPQQEIDTANQAIEAARTAGADQYVPEAFSAVVDSMNIVMAQIEATKSKFFKNYKGSIEKLNSITAMAGVVQDQTALKKTEIAAEVDALIEEVKMLTEENRKLVTEAPKGKEGKAVLEAMKIEIAAIEVAITKSATLKDSGDLIGAQGIIKATKEQALSLNAELKEVTSKYKKN